MGHYRIKTLAISGGFFLTFLISETKMHCSHRKQVRFSRKLISEKLALTYWKLLPLIDAIKALKFNFPFYSQNLKEGKLSSHTNEGVLWRSSYWIWTCDPQIADLILDQFITMCPLADALPELPIYMQGFNGHLSGLLWFRCSILHIWVQQHFLSSLNITPPPLACCYLAIL